MRLYSTNVIVNCLLSCISYKSSSIKVSLIKVFIHWGYLSLSSSTIEAIFHRGYLRLIPSFIEIILHWGFSLRLSFNEVCFHFSSSSNKVIFYWGRVPSSLGLSSNEVLKAQLFSITYLSRPTVFSTHVLVISSYKSHLSGRSSSN